MNRRRTIGWLIALAAVCVVVGLLWRVYRSPDGTADPATVEMPSIQQLAETRGFLRDRGVSVVEVHHMASDLLASDVGSEECEAVLGRLQVFTSPRELLAVAEAVSDPVMAELAAEELSATLELLGQCFGGESIDTGRLSFAHTVLDRRLSEAGI